MESSELPNVFIGPRIILHPLLFFSLPKHAQSQRRRPPNCSQDGGIRQGDKRPHQGQPCDRLLLLDPYVKMCRVPPYRSPSVSAVRFRRCRSSTSLRAQSPCPLPTGDRVSPMSFPCWGIAFRTVWERDSRHKGAWRGCAGGVPPAFLLDASGLANRNIWLQTFGARRPTLASRSRPSWTRKKALSCKTPGKHATGLAKPFFPFGHLPLTFVAVKDLTDNDGLAHHLRWHLHAVLAGSHPQELPPVRLPLRQRRRPADARLPLSQLASLGRQGKGRSRRIHHVDCQGVAREDGKGS